MPPSYPAQGGIFLFDGYFPNNVQTICKNDDMTSEMRRAEKSLDRLEGAASGRTL
jgi:hypothetical protein